MQHGRRRRRAHQNDLLDPHPGRLVDEADGQLGPVAQPMPFATPVAVGRKLGHMGRRGKRQPERGHHEVDQECAAGASPLDDLGLARAQSAARALKSRLNLRAEKTTDQVAAAVDVVHRQQHLAKPGLHQIVGERLDVATSQIGRERTRLARPAADEPPERFEQHAGRLFGRQRRRDEPPPERALESAAGRVVTGRADRRGDEDAHDREHRQHEGPRHDRRHDRRLKKQAQRPGVPGHEMPG